MLKSFTNILKYTFSNAICLIALVLFFFMFEFDVITSLILTLILGAFLYMRTSKHGRRPTPNRKNVRKTTLKRVSPEKETFYRDKGLSKDEMNLFRSTMHTAREEILTVESHSKEVNKLRAIFSRNDTIAILKDFFRHIVEQPQRLHEVNRFLYTHLPNLKELTEHYVEINQHVAKSKETYQALNTSAETIDEMCKLIKEDYINFMSNDIDNIDIEIQLANHVLNGHNGTNKTDSEPLNDEI